MRLAELIVVRHKVDGSLGCGGSAHERRQKRRADARWWQQMRAYFDARYGKAEE
jgi:hypothetical protein